MRAIELRTKSINELDKELLELLREHFSLRVQKANGQLNRHTRMRSVRRDIARVKTVINEKRAA
ncbi:50S ribosomal protein L29 [Candidatus Halobeggiatoa sp. HSG11]|nr:50S ribosomal protein L29 [Candidatus Halobeggiatoa sp. HSG11]